MKKLIPTFILLTLFYTTFSQSGSQIRVIKYNNDTLQGSLDNQILYPNLKASFIRIKTSLGTQEIEKKDIVSVFWTQKKSKYVFKTFNFEKLPRNAAKSRFSNIAAYAKREKQIYEVTALVKVLSEGEVNLYEFTDEDLELHLIVENEGEIFPLQYHNIGLPNGNLEVKEFQNQLSNIFTKSCKNISAFTLSKLYYNELEIQTIINEYNNCISGTDKPKVSIGTFQFEVFGNINVEKVKIRPDYNNSEYDKIRIKPQLGGAINYTFPNSNREITISNEFVYNSIKFGNTTIANGQELKLDYNFSFINYRPIVKFMPIISKPIFVSLGASFGLPVNQYKIHESIYTTQRYPIDDLTIGYLLGLGYKVKKLSFEARVSFNKGIDRNSHLSGSEGYKNMCVSIMARYALLSKNVKIFQSKKTSFQNVVK